MNSMQRIGADLLSSARPLAVLAAAAVLAACSPLPIRLGDKSTEARLKQLQPVAGKTSLYVCRVDDPAGRIRTTVQIDGKAVASLNSKTFAHALLDPGKHEVNLYMQARGQATRTSGSVALDAKAGEIVFLWVGVTGRGWGALTIDHFDPPEGAKACMAEAEYAVAME